MSVVEVKKPQSDWGKEMVNCGAKGGDKNEEGEGFP